MKTSIQLAFLCCLMTLLTMDACSLLEDNDNCKGTVMKPAEEPTIYLQLYFSNDSMPGELERLYKAKSAIFTGTITKVYCLGEVSGSFSFNPTFFPKNMSTETLNNGFFLPQPYTFKFENQNDYLLVSAHLKAFCEDGKIFETDEYINEFHYKDIRKDIYGMQNYITLALPKQMEAGNFEIK
jgi:hypothetical protein